MNRTTFVLLISGIGFLGFAPALFADPAETIEFGMLLKTSRCVTEGPITRCEVVASSSQNFSVTLDRCSVSQDTSVCFGSAEIKNTFGDHSFVGHAFVTKETHQGEVVNFFLDTSIMMDDADPSVSLRTTLHRGDLLQLKGPWVAIPQSNESYSSSFVMSLR